MVPKRLMFSCLMLLITLSCTYANRIIVAKDGSGSFTTVQAAINSIDSNKTELTTIFIKKGTYQEKIIVPETVSHVSFEGESREGTIITFSDYSGKFMSTDTLKNKQKYGTSNSYTMLVKGSDITLENLTIRNEAGRVGQAVALHAGGDRFIVRNCNIQGNQDTLLTNHDNTRQYYYNCEIEGTTDFIFGDATAVFDHCVIKSLMDSYITAASTTPKQAYGYVFFNCKLVANAEAKSVYLGRPWRPNARVVFLNSEFGKHIRPEGWHNWGKTTNEATAYYAEYNNKGEGANTSNRVSWSHQLTKEESKGYTLNNIFGDWKPHSKKSK